MPANRHVLASGVLPACHQLNEEGSHLTLSGLRPHYGSRGMPSASEPATKRRPFVFRASGSLLRKALLLSEDLGEDGYLDETTWEGAKRQTHAFANGSALAFGLVVVVLALPVNELLGVVPTLEDRSLVTRVVLALAVAAVAYLLIVYLIALFFWLAITPRVQRDDARREVLAFREGSVRQFPSVELDITAKWCFDLEVDEHLTTRGLVFGARVRTESLNRRST
jgi:hypothetical protein